ncbi:hypothetical protein MBLNU459_g1717t1 [Dothideomycetes sp. NU459]
MSAAQRMPVLAGTLGIGAVIAAVSTVPAIRNITSKYLNISAPGGGWRILAILFALINLKNLPFLWHYRVFRGIFYHLWLQPNPISRPHLFKPLITSSYNSIYDCDYNFHKSNSTYFGDLDVARAHYVGCLLRTSLARLNRGDLTGLPEEAKTTKGKYIVALGGVGCVFRKEIKPLERFEIWTRLLTWDNKWIYIVSHIVKKGAKKPTSYALQPWKNSSRNTAVQSSAGTEEKDMTKSIFASSIAKYVVKKGRLTIAPEIVLQRSDLLPPKPSNLPPPPVMTDSPATGQGTPATVSSPENLAAQVTARLGPNSGLESIGTVPTQGATRDGRDGEMTWDQVEQERLLGLEIAQHFDGLTALHGRFGSDEVLGRYHDFF